MIFNDKWLDCVHKKNSILCAGLDPAEHGQRSEQTLPEGADKLGFCLQFVASVAPYSAAVKINRNYIKDFSRRETALLVSAIHSEGMLAIDDSKLADIGSTNESGIYHTAMEGFDAVTFAPFACNTAEAAAQARKYGVELISLVLMSAPSFVAMKTAQFAGKEGYVLFAEQVRDSALGGIVLGAPSSSNHITREEIQRVHTVLGTHRCVVLVPGIGAQGGDARALFDVFGDCVMANVGRSLLYALDSGAEAKKYCDMLNEMRK